MGTFVVRLSVRCLGGGDKAVTCMGIIHVWTPTAAPPHQQMKCQGIFENFCKLRNTVTYSVSWVLNRKESLPGGCDAKVCGGSWSKQGTIDHDLARRVLGANDLDCDKIILSSNNLTAISPSDPTVTAVIEQHATCCGAIAACISARGARTTGYP